MGDQEAGPAALVIGPQAADAKGQILRGPALVIQEWPAEGSGIWVAPMHVHTAPMTRRGM